jgi:hypothetical protein
MIRIFTDTFNNLITSTSTILKAEADNNRLSSLSSENVLSGGVRINRDENAVAVDPHFKISNGKDLDLLLDVAIPSLLIAMLFVGNAIIVYIIFQHRKRKDSGYVSREEVALKGTSTTPQV